ncbi:MAG: hypothetical protein A3J79_11320 [Elusimicrobia bacterium RIFOXYB2_FULL_62_6]|nr:MAG: hypothetical protein A3J79_11320 [Elusimicrobia bacterium RIFOXYB2_FULL_62_6]
MTIETKGRGKNILAVLSLLAALLVSPFLPARAADSDSLQVTLSPVVSLSVTISTDTVLWRNAGGGADISGLDLGGLDLGATVYMVRPATFTVSTNYSATELDVEGAAADLGAWSFDSDGTAAQDQLQVYALMSKTSQASAPQLSDFDDGIGAAGDMIVASPRRYGVSGSDDGSNDSAFQKASFDSAGENLGQGEQRHMWLRLDLPPSTSDTAAKTFGVILTVKTDN